MLFGPQHIPAGSQALAVRLIGPMFVHAQAGKRLDTPLEAVAVYMQVVPVHFATD